MPGSKGVTALLVAAAVIAAITAGCGDSRSSADVTKIAIATPGHAGDVGWDRQGVSAARSVARSLRLTFDVADGVETSDASDTLRRLAADGASLVIAHDPRFAAAARAMADDTGVPALVVQHPERQERDRVGDIEIAAEEGGYLAGYIAARASYIRSVGIVISSEDPSWFRTAGGFIAGARRFSPDVRILYARAGADDDAAVSRRAARRLIARGAQMVIGLGRRSTLGVMQATQDALDGRGQPRFDAMFIDVIGDKSDAGHHSLTGLTAVIWNFAPAYRQAIRDLSAGTFGRRPYTLNLANSGVSVIADGRTPADNYRAALALGRRIEHGEIDVPVTTTDAQVRALLRRSPNPSR